MPYGVVVPGVVVPRVVVLGVVVPGVVVLSPAAAYGDTPILAVVPRYQSNYHCLLLRAVTGAPPQSLLHKTWKKIFIISDFFSLNLTSISIETRVLIT